MKKFKQYITEVQRYEYGGDWGQAILDAIMSIPYNGIFTPLAITQTTGHSADDVYPFSVYPWGAPMNPWEYQHTEKDPPPGWRPKDSAFTDPKPSGTYDENPYEWQRWFERNWEYIPPPNRPGNWMWDEDRGWYDPTIKPIDPTRWPTLSPQIEPTNPASGEEPTHVIPIIRPGLGSQHYEI